MLNHRSRQSALACGAVVALFAMLGGGCSTSKTEDGRAETADPSRVASETSPPPHVVAESTPHASPNTRVVPSAAEIAGARPSDQDPSTARGQTPGFLPVEPAARIGTPESANPDTASPDTAGAEPAGAEDAPPANDFAARPNPLRDRNRRPGTETPRPDPLQSTPPRATPKTVPQVVPSRPEDDRYPSLDESGGPVPLGKPRTDVEPAAAGKPAGVQAKAEPAAGKVRLGKHSGVPFDPIKENGPIFVGWEKPKLALVITGRQDGYLEPCGCAGLDRMKGGMARRDTLLKTLRGKGWPIVVLDVGGIANKRFSQQAVLKFQTTMEAMAKMGYDALMLGPNDLKLPTGEVLAATLGAANQQSLFVAANVALFDWDESVTPRTRIVEAGGKRLGITGVLGNKYIKEINNADVKMSDPVAALEKVVPDLKKNTHGLVLLAYADMKETLEIAKRFPQFDVVVTAGGPPEPPSGLQNLQAIPGSKAKLIEVGEKGMNLVVLGLFDDPKEPLRYQRVPLDSRFTSSPDMKLRMAAYQQQLKDKGLAGLGLRPEPHPALESNGRFVGSDRCQSCHDVSYRIWKKTPHAKALDTLVKADPPRHFDPECIACHVIGWNAREYYPYESGYLSQEKTPKMIDVGCESCHGPGEKHVSAESGSDKAQQEKLRQAVRITKEEAADPNSHKQNCFSCHDGDNSPDFDFNAYWPHVEHYESE